MAAVAAGGLGCAAMKFSWPEAVVTTSAYGAVVVAALAGGWAAWRRLEYHFIIPITLLCGMTVALLIADDPPPAPLDFGPTTPANSPSYAAYRMLVRSNPQNRISEFAPEVLRLSIIPWKTADWPEYLASNRAQIEEAWDKDALGRSWVEAMATAVPEGRYPIAALDGGWIDFRSFRQINYVQWGHAQLLAVDGDLDDAARAFISFLKANYHLQRGGSMMTTEMGSVIAVHTVYGALKPIVDSGQLSPGARAELAAALREAPAPEAIIHNIVAGENRYARLWFEEAARNAANRRFTLSLTQGRAVFGTGWMYPLLYNPNRTMREYNATSKAIEWLAEQRQIVGLQQLTHTMPSWTWKNPIGTALRQTVMPTMSKAVENIWAVDDQRIALLHVLDPDSASEAKTDNDDDGAQPATVGH